MNLARDVAYVGGQASEGRAQAAGADGRRRRVAASGGRGRGGGRQAKIAMSRQGHCIQGRTDGREDKGIPPQSGVTACGHKNFNSRQQKQR